MPFFRTIGEDGQVPVPDILKSIFCSMPEVTTDQDHLLAVAELVSGT
jgi:hypothetical protein